MSKIVWGLRNLRLAAGAKRGRALSAREAAEQITEIMRAHAQRRRDAGEDIDPAKVMMGRVRLNTLELGGAASLGELEALGIADYYTGLLGRRVSTSEIMEYDPNNKRGLELSAAA
jgi:hypothetical protein